MKDIELRKAAEQSLKALEEYQSKGAPFMSCDAAVNALRTALAQPVQGHHQYPLQSDRMRIDPVTGDVSIGYAPPQRKPLTNDRVWLEYMQLWPFRPNEEPTLAKDILRFARAIEAAHGIKE